jgi:outer membrane protein OmpA-like peptidoglycan-associated protein
MRYSLGATVKAEFDLLKKGKLALGAQGKFDAALAEGKAEGTVYLPDSNGWQMRPKIPVRKNDLKYKPIVDQDGNHSPIANTFRPGFDHPHFAVDSSLLTPSGARNLFEMLLSWDALKMSSERALTSDARQDVVVQVVGHTSAPGSDRYNHALGMRRAAVATDFIRQDGNYNHWLAQFAKGRWGEDEVSFMAYTILILSESLSAKVDWDALVQGSHKHSHLDLLKQQVPHLEDQLETVVPQLRRQLFLPRDQWFLETPQRGRTKPVSRLQWLIEWYVERTLMHYASKHQVVPTHLFRGVKFHSEPFISQGENAPLDKSGLEAFQNRRCDFLAFEIDAARTKTIKQMTPINLGEFRLQLRGHISAWAGANIQLGGELALATPKGMVAAVGAIRDVKNQGRVGEQTIKGAKSALSAGGNAAAFAGAKAELGLKGSADWRPPPPDQTDNKKPYFPPDVKSLGSIGYTITGMFGIGGKADLKIGFDQDSQRFVIRFAAQAALGPGFGGQLDITVGIGQCWEFITLVHGELERHDFHYLDIFEKEGDDSGIDVFELYSAWAWKLLQQCKAVEALSVMVAGKATEFVVEILSDVGQMILSILISIKFEQHTQGDV